MTQVNLLPWREEAKKKRKLMFGLYSIISIILAIIALILFHLYLNVLINHQIIRNEFLKKEIANKQVQLNQLNVRRKELDEVKKDLQFIMNLRNQSYKAVIFLTTLANLTPESLSYNKILRSGNKIILIGKAKSDSQITLLMENIGKSNVFKQARLTEITAKQSNKGEERIFQLTVEQQE